jgi:hypothetical protein
MRKSLTIVSLALLVAACSHANPQASSSSYTPSAHYGTQPCPSSATNNEGGHPTATDCVPGGME